jgi:Family of unknown function (DUF5908)
MGTVEIRELVIRAAIVQDNAAGSAQPSAVTQSGNVANSTEQLVNTCVEKVLEILKAKNQR